MWMLWLKFIKKVVAMAEIPKEGGRYGWNSYKKVVAMAEIPRKGGFYGRNS